MRRTLTRLRRAILIAALVGIVRAVLLDRSPRRTLDGTRPVVGSLDTWPSVPRRPTE